MKNYIIKQLKESFVNTQFVIIAIITVVSFCIFIKSQLDLLLYLFLLGLVLIILYIIGFFIKLKENIKKGKIRYEPYMVDKNRFIEECKMGLMYSLVRINDNIYEIETQLDRINSTNYNKFICYINENEIIGLDNFLDYKFDNVHSFNDLHDIEFLEYNHNNPKEYFINKNI